MLQILQMLNLQSTLTLPLCPLIMLSFRISFFRHHNKTFELLHHAQVTEMVHPSKTGAGGNTEISKPNWMV